MKQLDLQFMKHERDETDERLVQQKETIAANSNGTEASKRKSVERNLPVALQEFGDHSRCKDGKKKE